MCEADGRMGEFAGGWTVLSSSPPLFRHLPMMQKWVEYVCRAAGDSCIWSTGHQYGDWLALDAGEGNYTGASRKNFIATAFYAHSAQLLAQAMDALDMDGAAYHRLFEAIRAAHQNAFPDCRTQTECALALHFGLAAAPDRVAAQLAELVRSNGNRLTTGFVGTPYLLHALSENGYAQTAYDLLLQTEAPSWLFSVKMGATTVWEHWDSRKADGSFWSTDMNSFNHHAYGAVADWLYAAAGGIRPGKPGYETVIFAPVLRLFRIGGCNRLRLNCIPRTGSANPHGHGRTALRSLKVQHR